MSLPDYGDVVLDASSETSSESTVRSNLVENAGSRPISEAQQPWACPVLGWGACENAVRNHFAIKAFCTSWNN